MEGKKLKVILYKVSVADSAIDSIHGFIYQINEIYIPEYKISINKKFIYKTNSQRYKHATKIGEIEISKPTADIFKIYLKSHKVAMDMGSDLLTKYFPKERSRKGRNSS